MPEKNVNQRLLIVAIVTLVGFFLFYPPQQRLRAGLDIAGGTSLIFEVDTTGVSELERQNLAERVKEQLQKRVDPSGVYNLVWRVHGSNRIEVQMPLPPKDAKARQEAYRDALDDLYEQELKRSDLYAALRLAGTARDEALQNLSKRRAPAARAFLDDFERAVSLSGDERTNALDELRQTYSPGGVDQLLKHYENDQAVIQQRREDIADGIAKRMAELRDAATAYDEYIAARNAVEAGPPATQPDEPTPTTTQQDLDDELRDATELFDYATEEVLATNLNRRRFQEVLELDQGTAVRASSIEFMRTEHADLTDLIDDVLTTYQTYRTNKLFLDGPSDLKRLMRGAGQLDFRILPMPNPDQAAVFERFRRQLAEGRMRVAGDDFGWYKIDNPLQFFNLSSPAELETFDYKNLGSYVVERLGEDFYVLASERAEDTMLSDQDTGRRWKLESARPNRDQNGQWKVDFRLDPVGGSIFQMLTRTHREQPLCILVDDVAYSAPTIQSTIGQRGEITGQFSLEKVDYLAKTMEGGTLPARVKDTPLSERTVGSSLGEANRDAAVRAGLIGAVAVILLMIVYYHICGLVANVALSLNVMLVLAAMAMLNARITLDGIAGIILAVGMAVDANVLIYERIREEKLRGASLRMMIKNGYDKALSTIFDSNITTLLTCIIIYYVGSEEVKGFGLTLGWGIVLNLFTSVFVTRTLFGLLLKYHVIKDLTMLRLIGVPTINWYAKRKYFLPVSAIVLVIGLSMLFTRGADALDVEFRGGVAAEVELVPPAEGQASLNDQDIRGLLQNSASDIRATAETLVNAEVTPVPDMLGAFNVRAEGVSAEALAAMLTEPLEALNLLERSGVELQPDTQSVQLLVPPEVDQTKLAEAIRGDIAKDAVEDARALDEADVNAVLAIAGQTQEGLVWDVTTTATNMRLVEYAIATALGDNMRTQPAIRYNFQGLDDRPYPVSDRVLSTVVPGLPAGFNRDVTDYLGGAALHFTDLNPPQSIAQITSRLDNMRFQPDFREITKRDFEVLGVRAVDGKTDEAGNPLFAEIVIVSVDPELLYRDDPEAWWTDYASEELSLATSALSNEQTLRKVMQFKPQIAARSQQQASVAMLLAWGMIILYVWIRFGRPVYGVAGVAALIHDALIALAFVGFSGWIGGHNHPIGEAIGINDFKIDMTIIAALLTIIGYSVNDTIVVFDRIRETRGRLGIVTPQVINDSINQTLSRTLMTSITTLVILVIMYIWGGSSIRGFNYCMIIGIVTGSYSSIAIASPLLMAKFGGGGGAAQEAR
jgi:SecD/SecF fusion protein